MFAPSVHHTAGAHSGALGHAARTPSRRRAVASWLRLSHRRLAALLAVFTCLAGLAGLALSPLWYYPAAWPRESETAAAAAELSEGTASAGGAESEAQVQGDAFHGLVGRQPAELGPHIDVVGAFAVVTHARAVALLRVPPSRHSQVYI